MPTARELIEQADALMRRNRSQAERTGDVLHATPMPRIGSLEDAPPPETPAAPMREALAAPSEPPAAEVPVLTEAVAASTDAAEDVPLLTEAVEEIEAPPLADSVDEPEIPEWRLDTAAEGEVSEWRIDEEDTSVFARVPPSVLAAVPTVARGPGVADGERGAPEREAKPPAPGTGIEARVTEPGVAPATDRHADAIDQALGLDHPPDVVTPPQPAQATAPEAPAGGATDDARWDALAEDIRMQVLQRIDIFTDTGLRERLGERLKPVVDRASADLVATINQHVGDLLRAYVAEAIEREIEKWRQDNAGP